MAVWAHDAYNHVQSAVQKGVHVLGGALGAMEAVKGIYHLGQQGVGMARGMSNAMSAGGQSTQSLGSMAMMSGAVVGGAVL
jgi:hypothetical protein